MKKVNLVILLTKLSIYKEISEDKCEKILNAFIMNVDIIPYEEYRIFFNSRNNSINLMIDLLLNITCDKKRKHILENILNCPLDFSEEFLFYISNNLLEEDRNNLLENINFIDIERKLLEKAIEENSKIPLYISYPHSAIRLYELWKKYEGIESIQRIIKNRLESHPKEIYQFIECFSDKAYSSRNIYNIHMSDDNYKKIIEISDEDFIVQTLKEEHGSVLDDPVYEEWDKEREPRLRTH